MVALSSGKHRKSFKINTWIEFESPPLRQSAGSCFAGWCVPTTVDAAGRSHSLRPVPNPGGCDSPIAWVHKCAYSRQAMSIEWDSRKAAANLQKHRVDFDDAATALEDDRAVTVKHVLSGDEARYLTLGMDALGRVLVVV